MENWDYQSRPILIGVNGVTLGSDNNFGGKQYAISRTNGAGINHTHQRLLVTMFGHLKFMLMDLE